MQQDIINKYIHDMIHVIYSFRFDMIDKKMQIIEIRREDKDMIEVILKDNIPLDNISHGFYSYHTFNSQLTYCNIQKRLNSWVEKEYFNKFTYWHMCQWTEAQKITAINALKELNGTNS